MPWQERSSGRPSPSRGKGRVVPRAEKGCSRERSCLPRSLSGQVGVMWGTHSNEGSDKETGAPPSPSSLSLLTVLAFDLRQHLTMVEFHFLCKPRCMSLLLLHCSVKGRVLPTHQCDLWLLSHSSNLSYISYSHFLNLNYIYFLK